MNEFVINWVDDETVEFWLNGEYLSSVNHDEHGWTGIGSAIDLVIDIARVAGIPVREEGEPNL